MPDYVSPIPFECTLAHAKKQNKIPDKIHVNTEQPRLEWLTTENWSYTDK